jgi:hypothetical protein
LAIAPRRDQSLQKQNKRRHGAIGRQHGYAPSSQPARDGEMLLTIENRTSEETEELDEQVLLLGGDFVPTVALAASLDLVGGETLLDVGLEHLLGDEARVSSSSVGRVARAPELPPGRRLGGISGVGVGSLGVLSLGVSVGRDVLLQGSVLVWEAC